MSIQKSPGLEVYQLHKCYPLGETIVPVLQGLDVTVAKGEIVVIMGPSGAGKTTLLNCISGIDIPEQGRVIINDKPIDLNSAWERTLLRRHQLGIIFQFFNLIPTLTVKENIALPFVIAQTNNSETTARVDAMLHKVNLAKRQQHYPQQLSGGEMQLVSIARALVHTPPLVLADEPTGNVNPHIGRSIMNILRKTAKQQHTSVLMVTHSPEHAAWGDRICFLQDGVIKAELQQMGDTGNISAIHETLLQLGI